ncbi:hypothetical protein [Burkholderia glumae]
MQKLQMILVSFKSALPRLGFVVTLAFPFILAFPFSFALLDTSQRKSTAWIREIMFRKLNPWIVLLFAGVFLVLFVCLHKRKIKVWPVTLSLGFALSSTIAGYFSLAYWNFRISSFSDAAIFAATGMGVYICYVAVLMIVKK